MRTDSGAKAPDSGPRPPPSRPRPLEFPHYQAQGDKSAGNQHAENIGQIFLGLEKRVSVRHIEALNIALLEETPLDDLVPEGLLPSATWLRDPSLAVEPSDQGHETVASNRQEWGSEQETFYDRANQLLHDNDVCFDSLPGKSRARAHGSRPPVRLSHASKFYQNLLLMAESWDTSTDNYTTNENGEEKYTGRRYGAGHEMPPHYREDTISAFVEICVWPFMCNLQNPRTSVNRKLQFQKQYFHIQGITSTICRNHTDRQKARQGILQGPLAGIHCRNTTTFRAENEAKGKGKEEVIHLLFEIGAALLLAQKRARQGKTEGKPWQDRFWTTAERRHLGEMSGGKQDAETNARARREIEASKSGVEPMDDVQQTEKKETTELEGKETKKRRIQGPRQAYLATKPPESLWEPKMEYRAIGKVPGTGADDIYLISSINHHISILGIRIDDRYLDFMTNGSEQENFSPSTQEWWGLQMKRSRWFDLFDPSDRGEAMRGIWGVMSWMNRDVGGK
ncbi:MAG: hypothetical protein Q9168_007685 [Polycauliona sp. 1 TL-2023]